MEKVTITVTEKDIAEGLKDMCFSCPIALACKRVFPGRKPYVMNHITLYGGPGDPPFYRMPQVALDFINNFDLGKSVKPFEFQAELFTP